MSLQVLSSNEFDGMLNQISISENNSKSSSEWLISVTSSSGSELLSGTYIKFETYGGLLDYSEEINLFSGQNTGVKGVCFSDVRVALARSANTKILIDAFLQNNVMEKVVLMNVSMKKSTKKVCSIVYSTCKFMNVKSYFDRCEFFFKYGTREETYIVSDQSGSSQGQV